MVNGTERIAELRKKTLHRSPAGPKLAAGWGAAPAASMR
jgi:hypothetical protein